MTAGLSLLVYAMVQASEDGWTAPHTLAFFGVSAALLVFFVLWELRSPAPLVPFRIFRLRSLTAANLTSILIGAALFSMFFFVSLYMQQVLGYSPLKAGVSYLPLAVTIILSAGIASQLVTRLGFKPVLIAGMGFVAIGLFLFSGVSPDGSYVSDILPASVIAALGLGFSFVPVTIASQSGVMASDAGLASGLINTTQQIGGALGLAVLSTIATSRTEHVLEAAQGDPSQLPTALTEGFQAAFTVGAFFAIAGIVLALVLLRGKAGEEAEREVGAEPEAAR